MNPNKETRREGDKERGRQGDEHTGHQILDNPEVMHEVKDAAAKPVAYFLASLALLLVFTFVAVWLLFEFFEGGAKHTDAEQASPMADPDAKPPGPLLQITPSGDMRIMLEREKKLAESYGWVNKASGIVRIPVARAMELVTEKGLPNLQPIGVYEPPGGEKAAEPQGQGQPRQQGQQP